MTPNIDKARIPVKLHREVSAHIKVTVSAEGGEGGFEELVYEDPRGYVEPAPKTFEAIAKL